MLCRLKPEDCSPQQNEGVTISKIFKTMGSRCLLGSLEDSGKKSPTAYVQGFPFHLSQYCHLALVWGKFTFPVVLNLLLLRPK